VSESWRTVRVAASEGISVDAADNLRVHTQWTEAEDRHDLSNHEAFVHEDIEVRTIGTEPTRGIEAYRASLHAMYAGIPDFRVVLDDQFATDDRVVCRWRATGTHDGDLFGVPASGRHIEYSGVSVWEFDHGKARRGWIFSDVPLLLNQLGRGAP